VPTLALSVRQSLAQVEVGHLLTYTIYVTNSGSTNATGAMITGQLDDQVTFAAAGDGGAPVSGNVVWNVGLIPPGGPISRTVVVTVRHANDIETRSTRCFYITHRVTS